MSWSSTYVLHWCRKWKSEMSSIHSFHWNFSDEFHVLPNFSTRTIVHTEIVNLVVEVFLLERNEILLAANRSFHSIMVYFFFNQPGIRVSWSPPDNWRGFTPSIGPKKSIICGSRLSCWPVSTTGCPFYRGFLPLVQQRVAHSDTHGRQRQAFSLKKTYSRYALKSISPVAASLWRRTFP